MYVNNFKLPTKELVWISSSSNVSAGYYGSFDYSLDASGSSHPFNTAILQMSGQDRFSVRFQDYFYLVQNIVKFF